MGGKNPYGNLLVTKRGRKDKGNTEISGLCLSSSEVNRVGLIIKESPF